MSQEQMNELARRERAAIDAEVEGLTVCQILARNAAEHPDEPALAWKEDGTWRRLSWNEYRQKVVEVALALQRLGVRRGECVALMMRNRPEHLIADLAVLHVGGIPVSIYNTSSPEQIAYIVDDCGARLAIVDGPEIRARWEQVASRRTSLERVVVLDDPRPGTPDGWTSWDELIRRGGGAPGAVERTWRAVRPDDPCTLVYTSGTTGDPKGVVITHRNVVWTAASFAAAFPEVPTGSPYLSYLPLAHILERWLSIYFGLWRRVYVHFCPDPLQVFGYLPDVRPHGFLGVPRVWEKLAAGIQSSLAAEPNEHKRAIAQRAVAFGLDMARMEAEGRSVPWPMRVKRRVLDRVVYAKIRTKIGLDRCLLPGSGAAPLSDGTAIFFAGIGLPLLEGFAMTETSGQAICTRRPRFGTVGSPLPGVEVALSGDGELLLRGGNLTPGYHGKPEETARAIDAQGWLHTGDLAAIEDGFVKIVGRKKELIITSGGKNMAPTALEGRLRDDPLVAEACLVGDGRSYVTALLTLDREAVKRWALDHGVDSADPAELAGHPQLHDELERAVERANAKVSRHEQVKRFTVLPVEWTPYSGELTPSLKLRRGVIHERYLEVIDSMYGSPREGPSGAIDGASESTRARSANR